MNKPYLVGITGGIGAGKSTITEIFKLLGVPVYDADSKAKNLMINDKELVQRIIQLFGEESYHNGDLNRKYLAERVFSSENETARLNALVHPAVARDFKSWSDQQSSVYILKEAALLFESGSYKELEKVILVSAPEELRISRVQKRDPQRSLGQIKNIIERQMDQVEALTQADEVIYNDESNLLIPQVIAIDKKIKKAIR